MASWLVRSFPDRVIRVRALARDIVLCPWARHFTLTVPLSTQLYKWVPANLMLGVTLRWTGIHFQIGSLCSFIEPDMNGLIRSWFVQAKEYACSFVET